MLTDIRRLRNVAVVGHTGTGKTTLTEQLLFHGKVIPKAEKVETGRTVSDHTDEEIRRAISIHTTLSHISWQDAKINLFDTPGSADFAGEVIALGHGLGLDPLAPLGLHALASFTYAPLRIRLR